MTVGRIVDSGLPDILRCIPVVGHWLRPFHRFGTSVVRRSIPIEFFGAISGLNVCSAVVGNDNLPIH